VRGARGVAVTRAGPRRPEPRVPTRCLKTTTHCDPFRHSRPDRGSASGHRARDGRRDQGPRRTDARLGRRTTHAHGQRWFRALSRTPGPRTGTLHRVRAPHQWGSTGSPAACAPARPTASPTATRCAPAATNWRSRCTGRSGLPRRGEPTQFVFSGPHSDRAVRPGPPAVPVSGQRVVLPMPRTDRRTSGTLGSQT
jgi:hypothetical protein